MMKQSSLCTLTLVFTLIIGISACTHKQPKEKIVSVTIEPLRYFAEQIAGDLFEIHTVVPAGQNPESYDPAPRQMVQVGKSMAYFQVGHLGFEQAWMKTIRENNPDMKIFDLSEGIELIEEMNDHSHCDHDHEDDGHMHHHHHHGGVDPHTWSSVTGAKMIAWNMLNAFIKLDEGNAQTYWNNYNKLMLEIEETAEIIGQLLAPIAGNAFIIYHPALTYFANEFHLIQLCIEMDGKEPSPTQLKEMINTAKEYQAKVIFVQLEFDQKNAELIAKETGCRLITINPLAYNWHTEMIHIAKALTDE